MESIEERDAIIEGMQTREIDCVRHGDCKTSEIAVEWSGTCDADLGGSDGRADVECILGVDGNGRDIVACYDPSCGAWVDAFGLAFVRDMVGDPELTREQVKRADNALNGVY